MLLILVCLFVWLIFDFFLSLVIAPRRSLLPTFPVCFARSRLNFPVGEIMLPARDFLHLSLPLGSPQDGSGRPSVGSYVIWFALPGHEQCAAFWSSEYLCVYV